MQERVAGHAERRGFDADASRGKARHREQPTAGNIAPQQTNVVQQVARNVADVRSEVPADDLDVPTFLRRQAQKA